MIPTTTIAPTSTVKQVRLLEGEESILRYGAFPPITTVSWFEGDAKAAFATIRSRMNEIVRANPWLQGKFVNDQQHKGCHCISYVDNANSQLDVEEAGMLVYVEPKESTVFFGMPHSKASLDAAEHYKLKEKNEFGQPFWKVSIVPCSKSPITRFAVFVSLSHVVGDGHTFYQLHNMLLAGKSVQSLRLDRIHETMKMQKEKLDLKTGPWAGILCILRGVISEALGFSKVQVRTFLVDQDKVNEIKKDNAQRGDHDFISTNDIVTSWYLSNVGVRIGCMAVNFRGRLDGHNNDLAGNYSNFIYYRNQQDTSTPGDIRTSVKTMKRSITNKRKISGWAVALGSVAISTSWATFSEPARLADCKELLHLPFGGLTPPTLPVCCIFRARGGKLAVTLVGPGKQTKMRAPFESDEQLYVSAT